MLRLSTVARKVPRIDRSRHDSLRDAVLASAGVTTPAGLKTNPSSSMGGCNGYLG